MIHLIFQIKTLLYNKNKKNYIYKAIINDKNLNYRKNILFKKTKITHKQVFTKKQS